MNAPLSPPLLGDQAYPRLKKSLIAWTGLAYYADKDRELAEHIAPRLPATACADCASYLALLEDGTRGQAELDLLIADLTIGETFFFRHLEIFDALRTIVLPDLLERNRLGRHLRIWSAGCSTGAEPYSVSILLKQHMAEQLAGWDVTIIGTDINRTFLARARDAIYEEWAFRTTPEELRRTCFTRKGNAWRLNAEYREGVYFQYHNLVAHPSPSLVNNLLAFDVILCRNVTIYFSQEIACQLIGHFHQSLVNGGWLLVGHAEPNMELFRDFRTVNAPGAVLYQKAEDSGQRTEDRGQRTGDGEQRTDTPWGEVLRTPGMWPWTEERGQKTEERQEVAPSMSAPTVPSDPFPTQPVSLNAIRESADRGEWDKAAAGCRELLNKDKLNPMVYFVQALVLEQMGQHAPAEHSLRRAIYLDRGFVLGHYYLGLMFQKNQRLTEAARSFKNVIQLLARVPGDQIFADGDGISAEELRKLTEMHLEVLESA